MPAHTTVEGRTLERIHVSGAERVLALSARDFRAEAGEAVALVGRSGCGKSTLLNLLGLLEAPSSGRLRMLGIDVLALSSHERAAFRLRNLGFVFQNFCLLKDRSVIENVELPLVYAGIESGERRRRAMDSLGRVGMQALGERRPPQLSGGQQQRVAIARAMVGRPRIVLADEPTGSLDGATGAQVIDDLLGFCRATRATCIIATHDPALARLCHRTEVLDAATAGTLESRCTPDRVESARPERDDATDRVHRGSEVPPRACA